MNSILLGAAVASPGFPIWKNTLHQLVTVYSDLFFYPGAALLISLVMTFACIRLLPRLGFIDVPQGRHAHEKPTPCGGGLAIAFTFFLVAGVFALRSYYLDRNAEALNQIMRFIPPACLILITGIIDDRCELPSAIKLLVQIAVGMLVYFLGGGFYSVFGWQIPCWLGLLVTVIWVIAIINAFNLIDGLDGLAAGLAGISSFTLATWYFFNYHQPNLAIIILIFCGSCLGFLYYNFHPAKIFMGDTGSMFIGLFFAFISTSQVSKAISFASLVFPLLAMGVPLFDVVLAIWRRTLRKINNPHSADGIMVGDHDHLHHRILKRTGSDRKTTLFIYMLAVLLSLVALVPIVFNTNLSTMIFLLVMAGAVAVIRLADIELLDSATMMVKGLNRPSKRSLLMLAHPFIDLAMLAIAFCLCGILTFNDIRAMFTLPVITAFLAPFVLFPVLAGVYKTFWLRVGINRYLMLFKTLSLAAGCGFIMVYVLFQHKMIFAEYPEHTVVSGYVLFYLLILLFIFGERFIMRYMESFVLRNFYLHNQGRDEQYIRLLLVGGGPYCRLYFNSFFCRCHSGSTYMVVGILDDDRQLQHWNVYGFDVLGTTRDLEKIYGSHPFDHVVITPRSVTPEINGQITMFCRKKSIGLSYFHVDESGEPPRDFFKKDLMKSSGAPKD